MRTHTHTHRDQYSAHEPTDTRGGGGCVIGVNNRRHQRPHRLCRALPSCQHQDSLHLMDYMTFGECQRLRNSGARGVVCVVVVVGVVGGVGRV